MVELEGALRLDRDLDRDDRERERCLLSELLLLEEEPTLREEAVRRLKARYSKTAKRMTRRTEPILRQVPRIPLEARDEPPLEDCGE